MGYADQVAVIRTSDNTVAGYVTVGAGATGSCYLPGADYVYITNAEENTVSVIRTTDNTVVATIPVGPNARAIASDGAGERLYTANRSNHTVSVIARGLGGSD